MDIVGRLLELPDLVQRPFYYKVSTVVRQAAAEIERLRGSVDDDYRCFDKDRAVIIVGSEVRLLNAQEFLLMERLVKLPGRMVTYRQCLDALYAMDPGGGPESNGSLRTSICTLRKKSPWPIRNIHSIGYLLEGYRAGSSSASDNDIPLARLMAGR